MKAGDVILNGKYRIQRLIGEGGMARVWLAEEPAMGRLVAIKEPRANLPLDEADEVRARYRREVQVCAALEKAGVAHIVPTLTAEPHEGGLLLVLAYMPGGDLAALLKQHPLGMPVAQAVRITLDLLQALAGVHAHELEIVHRDIKPSNVLFGGQGVAHLADFGLAQVAGTSQDLTKLHGRAGGTPLYAAPEQEMGKGYLTAAADLYSLGCVLFEMLTGQRYKRHRPGTPPSRLRPEVASWLDAVLARALEEDPWDRWPSAEEMAEALAAGQRAQREAETRARQEAEELARREAEREAQRAAAEQARHEAEERARREADARARRRAEERAHQEAVGRLPGWAWALGALAVLALAVGLGLALGGGGGQVTPGTVVIKETVVVTREIEKEVVVTQEVEKAVVVEVTSTPRPTATRTPAPPTATPRPQWIAFETERGERSDYEVFVVTADGSRLANISHSWADDVAPVWSPNGQRIAFVSFRDTLAGKWSLGPGSIYLVDFDPLAGVDRGDVIRLTDDEGSDGWPTWSPDGRRIAFESDRSGNWDIWIVNVDGSGLVNLTRSPEEERYPAWSPDGKRLAFTSRRNGPSNVWLLNVEEALQGAGASNAVNLTKNPHRDRYAMWSPDGTKIAFNTNRDGDQEIYIMNADGSNQTNFSQSPDSIEGLADWSPDGRRLVLYSDRPGNKDLFVVDLATKRWTNITNHPASDEFCTWSP